jgi:hypothetical protein
MNIQPVSRPEWNSTPDFIHGVINHINFVAEADLLSFSASDCTRLIWRAGDLILHRTKTAEAQPILPTKGELSREYSMVFRLLDR